MPKYKVHTTPAVLSGHHRLDALVTTSSSREQLLANINLLVAGDDHPVKLKEGRKAIKFTELSVVSALGHLLFTVHEIESEEEKQAHNSTVMKAVLGGRDPGVVQMRADEEGWESSDRDVKPYPQPASVRVYETDTKHIWAEHLPSGEAACFSGPRRFERLQAYIAHEYPREGIAWNIGPDRRKEITAEI